MAVVEQRQQPAFLAMTKRLGLAVEQTGQIEGFNMSKGDDIIILLYRADGFDPRDASG